MLSQAWAQMPQRRMRIAQGFRHTLRIRNMYRFSTATMVSERAPVLRLYVYSMSY